MKLSIIIPVYKVQDYISDCVNSVLRQNLIDTEIILVDDGSPDNCGKICDDFAKHNNNIKIIHKENGGLSDARNVGIREASGEYIMFLDGDDFLETTKDYFSEIIENIDNTKLDLYYFTSIKEVPSHNDWSYTNSFICVSSTVFLKKIFFNTPFQAAWLFIVKKSFLVDNGLFFKNGIYHEDEEWMPRILLRNEKDVGVIDLPLYCYRTEREGSIINTVNPKKIECIREICEGYVVLYNNESDNVKKRFLATKISKILISITLLISNEKPKNNYDRLMIFNKVKRNDFYQQLKINKHFFLKSFYLRHRILYFMV